MDTSNVLRRTYSVCPCCFERIPAIHVLRGKEVVLYKECPVHGHFSSVIWRGLRNIDEWRGDIPQDDGNENCPHECGLCASHMQGTCCIVLEITKRCNLNCTFCFADGGQGEDIPFETVKERLMKLAVPGKTLVQLSGGETTVRDDLPKIVRAAKEAGCQYVQINSNGIRLGEDEEFVKQLADNGLSFVFMQFDGTDDKIYRDLRGQDLLDVKKKAIENCNKYNIGITLVPTLVPKINTFDIGSIIRFGIENSPAVRGIHFQPVSYFGRTPGSPTDDHRFTLDQLLTAIEEQAGDLVPEKTLLPSRCDHPLCGFHGDYIVMPGKKLHPLHVKKNNCCTIATAEQNRNFIARKWQRPIVAVKANKKTEDNCCNSDMKSFDQILSRLRSHSFTLTAMVFQDAYNLDLERLQRCSLHVYDSGKMVPFCAYYIKQNIPLK